MRKLLLIALLPLAGCAVNEWDGQANYRAPRADELRPGDVAPPPGPFVDSMPNTPRQAPRSGPAYIPYIAPIPPVPFTPMAVPQYQQPQQVRPPVRCSTRYVGNTAYTDCY